GHGRGRVATRVPRREPAPAARNTRAIGAAVGGVANAVGGGALIRACTRARVREGGARGTVRHRSARAERVRSSLPAAPLERAATTAPRASEAGAEKAIHGGADHPGDHRRRDALVVLVVR